MIVNNRYVSILFILCVSFFLTEHLLAQEHSAVSSGTKLKIQRLVRDLLGSAVTLNFKDSGTKTGNLVRANGDQFVLEIDGNEEHFETALIHSLTKKAGLSEGILMVASAAVVGGFGLGATALLFEGSSPASLTAVAVVFAVFGGWLGFESFFQDVEVVLP